MPDLKFYQMYHAMGGKSDGYFDMLGVHGAGYAAPPEIIPGSRPQHNNDPSPAASGSTPSATSRTCADLMVKNGDQTSTSSSWNSAGPPITGPIRPTTGTAQARASTRQAGVLPGGAL